MNTIDVKPNEPFGSDKEKYEYEIYKQKEKYIEYKEELVPMDYKNINNTSQSIINVNK